MGLMTFNSIDMLLKIIIIDMKKSVWQNVVELRTLLKKKKGLLVVDNVEFLLLFESGKFDCNNNKCIYKGYM